VDNTPSAIAELIGQIRTAQGEHGLATVGIDLLGGITSLLQAMLLQAGLTLGARPRLGGQPCPPWHDRRGAQAIPTTRGSSPTRSACHDLRRVEPSRDDDVELRLLIGRRIEIVADQTRRAARLRDLLVWIHPGLERVLDPTGKAGLHLLTRHVTPAELRAAGRRRLLEHLRAAGRVKDATVHALVISIRALSAMPTSVFPGRRRAEDDQ
jgi:hypothetical protein